MNRSTPPRARTGGMSATECGKDVHDALEAVCRRGCRYVLQVIAALERDEIPGELRGLDPVLRQQVMAELQEIMAVYDRECSLDPGEPTVSGRPDSIRE